MFVKIHKTYRDVVAICDSEIIGKFFESEDKKFQLDVKESFFKGQEHNEDSTLKIMKDMSREDATFNIIGENSVKLALEAGIINEKGIKSIQGIPFALILL
ncbi:DUF424 family protein [Candidatus Pacearchaeota archaeon]|nr:DUF424 family protein [Candidatus Pacearchaeota archaeon]